MKKRPLGVVSDFVVERLPRELHSPAFADIVTSLMRGKSLICRKALMDAETRALASLDLKMIEAAMVHSGIAVPPSLAGLVDAFSVSRVRAITYEEIVLVNPHEDLRTFTTGEVGETEAAFYNMHRTIETQLVYAISSMHSAIAELRNGDAPASAHALEHVVAQANGLPGMVHALGLMTPGHFPTFRRYLMSHPTRNLHGPSGAFSAGIPTLEILFRGNELPEKYIQHLKTNWEYLPLRGHDALTNAIRSKDRSLMALWRERGEDRLLKPAIDALGEIFNTFRRAHYNAVGRQLPEALKDETPGTAGEVKPGEFLRDRMESARYRGEQ
mgnify:CR=1 FL=1